MQDILLLYIFCVLPFTLFMICYYLCIYHRYYADVLRGLYPLFGESEPDDAVRDNAAGAVARMIMVNPESVPLNQVFLLVPSCFRYIAVMELYIYLFFCAQVLPVFLKVLPLKEDHEESMAVYSCICHLVLSSNSQVCFVFSYRNETN